MTIFFPLLANCQIRCEATSKLCCQPDLLAIVDGHLSFLKALCEHVWINKSLMVECLEQVSQ